MLNYVQKHIDLKLANLCLILSFLYNLFFNSSIILSKKINSINAAYNLLPDIFYLILLLFAVFWGFAIHKRVFLICSVILFLSGAIASFNMFFYSSFPSLDVMRKFWGEGFNNIYRIFDLRLIAWLAFSGFACIYTIRKIQGGETSIFFSKLLSAFCLVLTVNGAISPKYKILTSYFPFAYLHNSYLLTIK